MDYNPFDPIERAEALRDEIVGLRTTPEVGFFNTDWYVRNTQEGNYPEAEKSLLDFLLFKKRWHKDSRRQTPEEYITQFLSKNHFQKTTFKDTEKVRVIRGDICLEFAIGSCLEKTSKVKLDSGAPTTLLETTYNLSYAGWKCRKGLSLDYNREISNPDLILFLDTRNEWENYANAFSNHYVKFK